MTKKILLATAALALGATVFAQNGNVGIGTTTPNADAKLDITATNKGLLLPRVALTGTANAAPLSAHVAGMTVYNTKDTLDVSKGTYYNNGIKWIKVGDASQAWNLTGNAGTTPGTNYLGTKDSNALVFKTNATNDTSIKMTILPNGNVGIGTASPASMNSKATLDVAGNVKSNIFWSFNTNLGKNHPVFMNLGTDYTFPNISFQNLAYIKAGQALGVYSNRDAKSQFTDSLYGGSDIYAHATEDFTSTSKGSNMTFSTTQNGTNQQRVRIKIDHNGNVGISTQNPLAKLHIDGMADNPATGTPTAAQQINDVVVTNKGWLGIGLTNPASPFHVRMITTDGNVTANNFSIDNYQNSSDPSVINQYYSRGTPDTPANLVNGDAVGGLWITGRINGASPVMGTVRGVYVGDGTTNKYEIHIENSAGGIHLASNGNVGIGTATPSSKLQVTGIPAYNNDAAAGAAGLTAGAFWQTASTNTIGLPAGVLMVKQ